jgi:hypothetical protein
LIASIRRNETELASIGAQGIVPEKLKSGEEVIVVLERVFVRDNNEWIWGDAEINISFQVATKNFAKEITIGTFTGIKPNSELIENPIVLLPATKLEDYLNIGVTAIELDRVNGVYSKIPDIMKSVNTLAGYVPAPGFSAGVRSAGDIVASIVNIAGLINTDDSILHATSSYVIDNETYPGLRDNFYLRAGLLKLEEKGVTENPTAIWINIMKKKI